jgi:CBS domain-containing protein
MSIKEICSRVVVFVRKGESIADAARLMREHHVGSLVVVEEAAGKRVPAGMLTDRDIAIGVVALGLDPDKTPVEAAMRADLVAARESDGIGRAVTLMRSQGVRRVPVVDAAGALVGVLAADDLMELFAEETAGLAAIIGRGAQRERALRTASL